MSYENATIGWGLLPSYKLGALCSAQEILRNSCTSRTYSRTLSLAGRKMKSVLILFVTLMVLGYANCSAQDSIDNRNTVVQTYPKWGYCFPMDSTGNRDTTYANRLEYEYYMLQVNDTLMLRMSIIEVDGLGFPNDSISYYVLRFERTAYGPIPYVTLKTVTGYEYFLELPNSDEGWYSDPILLRYIGYMEKPLLRRIANEGVTEIKLFFWEGSKLRTGKVLPDYIVSYESFNLDYDGSTFLRLVQNAPLCRDGFE